MTKDSKVEGKLTSLADAIDWPTPSSHLTSRVMARIESGRPSAAGRRGWRRTAIAATAVLTVSVVMVLLPSAREAVADLLNAAGIRIGFTSAQAPATGADLNLGESIRINDVENVVDFDVRIPAGNDPGTPDAVYLSDSGRITMAWAGTPTLPTAGDTDVGMLLTQYKANGDQEVAEKSIGAETEVQRLIVEGQLALWIEGAAHTFTLSDTDGNPIEETTRLAANVLLWDSNGVSHRLETTGALSNALAIVDTLQPPR